MAKRLKYIPQSIISMKATFGAGCFWHVEEAYASFGKTQVGFMGGDRPNSYKEVCRGDTGHTEVCEVEYDPKKVSYEELLDTFWKIHDPHHKAKTQYKSVIFYHNKKQKELAEKSLKQQEKKLKIKLTTEILPAKEFYRAEEYHQGYYKKSFFKKVCRM